jgi:hypothetical protein
MQQPVKERVAKLREEISQIREANHQYVQGGKKMPSGVDHQRRLQRSGESNRIRFDFDQPIWSGNAYNLHDRVAGTNGAKQIRTGRENRATAEVSA